MGVVSDLCDEAEPGLGDGNFHWRYRAGHNLGGSVDDVLHDRVGAAVRSLRGVGCVGYARGCD